VSGPFCDGCDGFTPTRHTRHRTRLRSSVVCITRHRGVTGVTFTGRVVTGLSQGRDALAGGPSAGDSRVQRLGMREPSISAALRSEAATHAA
jgi:hypothetical protein